MRPATVGGWGAVVCLGMFAAIHAAEIPFPAALDEAAVAQTRLTDLNRAGLVLGNGDLTGLLWERHGAACIRVTKNDLWDARIDTSQDPPLLRVDVSNRKWEGVGRSVAYDDRPYPRPCCAAVVTIGGATTPPVWRAIRAGGTVNEWQQQGDAGAMIVAGAGTVSAGYRHDLSPAAGGEFEFLSFRISGNAEAQYYVNIFAPDGKAIVESGWIDSPAEEREATFAIPDGGPVGAVEIYVQSKRGARAENRIRQIALNGSAARLAIPAGMPAPVISAGRLDLRRAVAELSGSGMTGVTVRALADRNAFLIETDQEVSLEEVKAAELPAAEQGVSDAVRWLHRKLPGDLDYAGMEYAVAVASAGQRKAVAVVTSRETRGSVREEAIRLARQTAAEELASLVERHERAWADYWSASGVQLGGAAAASAGAAQARDFQQWWYRMVYFNRCFAKAGVVPAGLWSVLPMDDVPWHGDYHHNYNAWQPYWTPLILNHPELADPWVQYLNDLLPRMRWLAKTTYDCPGAYVGIASFPFEPDPAVCRSVNRRQIMLAPFSYTVGMVGMSAQVLWMCHLYRPDRAYLESRVYPVVREAALFYAAFAEKCPRGADGKAEFGPSYSPEHGRFGVVNVPFDLAYARYTLKAAAAAARELGRDADLSTRFDQALGLLPDYPTAPDAEGRPVVVDWTGCKFRQIAEHNITVPAVPVFPAEQVTWFSPQAEKDLFANTLRQTRHRGCNSTVMFSVAKARLSMLDALDDAHRYYQPLAQPNGMFYWPMHGFYLTESVGIAAMISEYLVQSVDGIVRVFPCWPREQDARFRDLRAQGGFLVSAEQSEGRIRKVEVTATVGGKLRLLDPWTGQIVERTTSPGEKVVFTPRG